jgi:phenylalanyl-tRNA synthetase alpha chain
VHPNVLNSVGIDSREWSGFAFGVGLDRIVMMKTKLDDIRNLYTGDLRVIKQF